jgi:hypothetical protein
MLGAKFMKKKLNYLALKRWEKVGNQELRSTPYKQEIDPWYWFKKYLCITGTKFTKDITRSILKV